MDEDSAKTFLEESEMALLGYGMEFNADDLEQITLGKDIIGFSKMYYLTAADNSMKDFRLVVFSTPEGFVKLSLMADLDTFSEENTKFDAMLSTIVLSE